MAGSPCTAFPRYGAGGRRVPGRRLSVAVGRSDGQAHCKGPRIEVSSGPDCSQAPVHTTEVRDPGPGADGQSGVPPICMVGRSSPGPMVSGDRRRSMNWSRSTKPGREAVSGGAPRTSYRDRRTTRPRSWWSTQPRSRMVVGGARKWCGRPIEAMAPWDRWPMKHSTSQARCRRCRKTRGCRRWPESSTLVKTRRSRWRGWIGGWLPGHWAGRTC